MLTPRGNRIVFSSRTLPGPPEVFIVNWDGTGLRKLAGGYALALWENPADGSEWVYVGTDNKKLDFATVTRFPIDAPAQARAGLEQDAGQHGMHSRCRPTAGTRAACFPGRGRASPNCRTGEMKRLGEGCWTALTSARGPLFWYFDGAHRNLTMVDVDTGRTMDGEHQSRARIRRRGGVPPALDEPPALPGDLRALQPGRSQPGPHRRQAGRGVCRPLQRGLLESRGVGPGDNELRRRFVPRRLDRRGPQPASAAADAARSGPPTRRPNRRRAGLPEQRKPGASWSTCA